MSDDPQQPQDENRPPTPPQPERRVEVKNSRGTVIGDFNNIVQNYLADPKMRYFLLGLAALIVISSAVVIFVLSSRGKKDIQIALSTAVLPTSTPAPTPTPKAMHRLVNVAVAEFTLVGEGQDAQIGFDVAETLKQSLDTSLTELVSRGDLELWGPGDTGKLDPADPVRAAQEKARAIHAHIIIYGTVDASRRPVSVTPQFYISDEDVLYDTRELTGEHSLGAAIQVFGEPLSAPFNVLLRDGMGPRVRVLTLVIQALSYYSVHKFDQALGIFSQAAPLPPIPAPGTPVPTPGLPPEGREVIYLLAGNAAGKSGNLAGLNKQYDQAGQYFEQAARYFDLSLADDPDYARAMIGKAGVLYIQALSKANISGKYEDVDIDLLNQAITLYQQAAKAAHQPAGADVEAKVRFGLGQCRYWLVLTGRETSFNPAVADFQAVISAYDSGDEDARFRLRDMAGISHGHLGYIYEMAARPDLAKVEFQQAIELLKNSFETGRVETYQKRLAKLNAASPTPTPPS